MDEINRKIEYKCSYCKKISNKFGAILLSPPKSTNGKQMVAKFHVCPFCYNRIKPKTYPQKRLASQ